MFSIGVLSSYIPYYICKKVFKIILKCIKCVVLDDNNDS